MHILSIAKELFQKSDINISIDNENFKFIIEKTHDSSNNSHNDKLINICKSINKLDISDRQILYDKYFRIDKNDDIALSVSYSMDKNSFYNKLKNAIKHFYDIYKNK